VGDVGRLLLWLALGMASYSGYGRIGAAKVRAAARVETPVSVG
jgi:hypothetical protein